MKPKKIAMIEALRSTFGVVTPASKLAEISRGTHYNWMKSDDEYRTTVQELKNMAVDFAESKLLEQIGDGNTTAIIFYLKTQAKDRGYVERSEQHVSVDTPIQTWLKMFNSEDE